MRRCVQPALLAIATLAAVVGATAPLRVSAVASGQIRGRVILDHVRPAIERRPNVGDLGAPDPRDEVDRSTSVVYLESAPRGAFEEAAAGHASMDQRHQEFAPHVLPVLVGTVVDFPNSDPVYHDVFSLSKAARFDLGRYPMGRSKSIRFDRPGIVHLFCDIHSHMSAFILVFTHPYFATTGEDGAFRIAGVPPGTYNVIAWNEGVASAPKPVTVTSEGEAEADFTLR